MDIVPAPKAKKITYSQYERYTPEKLELVQGDLLWSEQERINLLLLLLYNVGLEAFLQHLPEKTIQELTSLLSSNEKK
ncbi:MULTISPECIES: hypothetical protein [Bacillaceae]|uniref:hypothetical protein n=1 Tax=Anoxybacillaceae TaxID=3120669 RepID=UPI0020501C64|nr:MULTISPECIES: hypothetical protein [Bacillaceae]UPT60433.1 hypothetical protein GK107_14055 [Geobacillus thermoleovorans]GLH64479.1 hypothetical protein PG301_23180 [Parageobacillus sp. G301]